jgi:malonyl-CoA O-methyltransferase
MSLHWAPDAPTLMRAWHKSLVVDGFLMFSTLGPGTLAGLREAYQGKGWGTPYPPWTDMHDLGDMLVEAGFADPVMDQETLRLTYSSPAAALSELRVFGANADCTRFAGLRTAALARPPVRGAGRPRRCERARRAEFEIVYGHAFKAAPRARLAAQTEVGLADMKTMLRHGRTPI